MARVIVITGLQGAGKTTLAEELRARHGFIHFDGDLWTSGANPVAGDYETELGLQQAPTMEAAHKQRFENLCTFLLKLRSAQDPSSIDEPCLWQPFFAAFCQAVQDCRLNLAADSPGLVVSQSVHLESMREFIKQSLGENTCVLALQLPLEIAVERAAVRCTEQYTQVGKSLEEWKAMLSPNQAGYQDAMPAKGTIVLDDDGSSDRTQFVAKAERVLGLPASRSS